jgi:hypothetical protein
MIEVIMAVSPFIGLRPSGASRTKATTLVVGLINQKTAVAVPAGRQEEKA